MDQTTGARRVRPVRGRKLPGGRVADRLGLPSIKLLAALDALGPDGYDLAAEPSDLLLVTFRRSGTRVATPVWAGWLEGAAYVRTQRSSGKVKRLRHNPAVMGAPCTTRGMPLAAARAGLARILEPAEESRAERALRQHHGRVRAVCAWIQDRLRVDMCYLSISWEEDAGEGAIRASR